MTLRAAAEQALKPCPFCGSEPYSCRHLSYSNWGVTCECGAIGPTKNAGYRPLREAEIRAHNEAVAAWNERAALAAEQPEPVAWRWLSSDGLEWLFVERRSWAPSIKGVEVEPLYAAPPPAAPQAEARRTLSWSGFNLHGDDASIAELQRLMSEAAATDCLRKRLAAQPAPRDAVTDEMIERGIAAMDDIYSAHPAGHRPEVTDQDRAAMRAALVAAMGVRDE